MNSTSRIGLKWALKEINDNNLEEFINDVLDEYPNSYQEIFYENLFPVSSMSDVHKSGYTYVEHKTETALLAKQKQDQLEWERKVLDKIKNIESLQSLIEYQQELEYFFKYSPNSYDSGNINNDKDFIHMTDDTLIHYSIKAFSFIEHRKEYLSKIRETRPNQETEKSEVPLAKMTDRTSLEWTGNKNELEELIRALYLSKKIYNPKENRPATQEEIIKKFNQFIQPKNAKEINADQISGNILKYYRKNKRFIDNVFHLQKLESFLLQELRELIQKDKDERLPQ